MMKRKILMLMGAAILVVSRLMGIGETEASECYHLYFTWNCVEDVRAGTFNDKEIDSLPVLNVGKHKDHSIDDFFEFLGVWWAFGDSFQMLWDGNFFDDDTLTKVSQCAPIFSGRKSGSKYFGFFNCRENLNHTDPGCWIMVKTTLKDCPWITER